MTGAQTLASEHVTHSTLLDTSSLTRYGRWITAGRNAGFWECACRSLGVPYTHHALKKCCLGCGCLAPEAIK